MTESSAVATNTLTTGQLYQHAYDKMMGNTTQCAKVANLLSHVILLAVFIIACVSTTQASPHFALSWSVVGLGFSYLVSKLIAGDLAKRKIDVLSSALISALIIIFGALSLGSVLPPSQMGLILIGCLCARVLALGCAMIYAKRHEIQ